VTVTRRTKAAVVRAAGLAPALEELTLAAPEPHEVVIRVGAAGVCHTDLAMARGELWPVYPVVLGHEIAGTVVECGSTVTTLAPGQRVLVLDGHCGRCADCERGHPVQCRTFDLAERRRHLFDGSGAPVLQSMGGFAELLVCPAHSVFPIPDDVGFEIAAITACAVVTGVGAVVNVARPAVGDSVAIVGCGGVGLSAVMAAAAAGASEVLGIDPDTRRRDLAARLGATATAPADLAVLRGRFPDGFATVIECAGQPGAMRLATQLLARGGTAVLTGAPRPDATIQVDALDLILNQRRVVGCLRGDVRPDIDLPMIFNLFRQGRLPLDRLVTDRIALADLDRVFVEPPSANRVRTVVVPTAEG
jgi:Zn-dependent alcohol dehydrogenase